MRKEVTAGPVLPHADRVSPQVRSPGREQRLALHWHPGHKHGCWLSSTSQASGMVRLWSTPAQSQAGKGILGNVVPT